MLIDRRGVLWSRCRGKRAECDDNQVGITVFHVHTNALSVARGHNINAGRKVKRITVRDGHFHVVPVSGNQPGI